MSLKDTPQFQIGRTGEELVAEALRGLKWFVIPSYAYSAAEDKAPKLAGPDGKAYVLPDLDTARAGHRIWVEVKSKSDATYTRKTRRFEHGIPLRHFDDYLAVQHITGTPVYIVFREISSGLFLWCSLNELALGRRYTGNRMSRGGMIFIARDELRVGLEDFPHGGVTVAEHERTLRADATCA